jgi:hypothetical protein
MRRGKTRTLGLMRRLTTGIALTTVLAIGVPMAAADADEQAVIVHLRLSGSGFGEKHDLEALFKLEEAIATSIERSSVGEHDGNEVGEGEFVIYCYGPNADALFAAIEPALRSSPLSKGATVLIRYGKPGARHREVKL